MQKKVVEVKGLTRYYKGVLAVDNIDFTVYQGEIFGLLGPNGAGKTTTLEILEGLRRPDQGEIRIMGLDPHTDPTRLFPLMGVQLQTANLPDTIQVQEAVNLFAAYHRVSPSLTILEDLGLLEKKNAQYHTLSTGQKRKLALALAILHNPSLIFFDEPTAGLDVETRVTLHKIMTSLKEKGRTIILSTHDMAEAEDLADRVAILLEGRIVSCGSPRELTASGRGLTRIAVKSTGPCLEDFTPPGMVKARRREDYALYFVTDIGAAVLSIINWIQKNQEEIVDLRVERPSLEERFLELTKKEVME